MRFIAEGLNKGVDVSYLPAFNDDYWKVEVIYQGLIDGLDVSWYADYKFTKYQMWEIYYGLKADADISPDSDGDDDDDDDDDELEDYSQFGIDDDIAFHESIDEAIGILYDNFEAYGFEPELDSEFVYDSDEDDEPCIVFLCNGEECGYITFSEFINIGLYDAQAIADYCINNMGRLDASDWD